MIRQSSREAMEPNGQKEEQPEKMRCHERLHELMHRPIVEAVVIFLIVVDALLVVSTLVIELRSPCSCPAAPANGTTHGQPISATDPNAAAHMEEVMEALHLTSLAILCVFMVEVFLKVFAQREKFFHHKMQVIDAFVIVISFAVDVAVVVVKAVDESSGILNGLGLLVLLRLWRLVRIVNSAVLTTQESIGNKVIKERQLREAAESHAETLEQSVTSLQEENSFLRMRLIRYEQPQGLLQSAGQASKRDHASATMAPKLPPYLPDSTRLPTNVLGDLTDGEYDTAVFSKASSSTTQPTAARAYISMDLDPDNLTARSTTDSDSMTMATSALRFANAQTVKKSGVPMTAL